MNSPTSNRMDESQKHNGAAAAPACTLQALVSRKPKSTGAGLWCQKVLVLVDFGE